MSSGVVVALAVVAVAVLGGLFLITTSRRSDRNAATGLLARETMQRDRSARKSAVTTDVAFVATPLTGKEVERAARGTDVAVIDRAPALPRPPMDAEQLGVTRRQFLNRSTIAMFGVGLGGFGTALLAFLWPPPGGGFGGKVKVGKLSDILAAIDTKKEPVYVAEARAYIVPYPKDSLNKAKANYAGPVLAGMESGVVALYQKCVHLGCKVPWCGTSQWFECPCHGSQYNRVGEKKGGPAPRGLDRFAASVDADGVLTVDSGQRTEGPPIGVNTTGQEAEGPHCVGGKE